MCVFLSVVVFFWEPVIFFVRLFLEFMVFPEVRRYTDHPLVSWFPLSAWYMVYMAGGASNIPLLLLCLR